MLEGKKIAVGVCGGIAAFKAAALVSALVSRGAEVKVIMTKSACEFVTPLTFRSLSKNPVAVNMFDDPNYWEIEHIALAKWAELLFIVPATANIIGKIAGGIADDMLSTVAMATKAPLLIAPAMNTAMYESAAVCENIKTLRERGVKFVEPSSGVLACGDVGKGRLPDRDTLIEAAEDALTDNKDYLGKKILITAGPTREAVDPVRFISNNSTGKMGYEAARAAKRRGAQVTLISGPCALEPPCGVELVRVVSAREMYDECVKRFPDADIVIMTAAVADYRPEAAAEQKIKKSGDMSISLVQNPDILKRLGELKRENQILVGFCMETQNLLENAGKKLKAKRLDYIAANNLFDENAGFAADNNTVTVLTRGGDTIKLPNMSKLCVADEILSLIGRES